MRLRDALSYLDPARSIVPAERREDYERASDEANAERLRAVAWAAIIIFIVLFAQNELIPGVPRDGFLFAGYAALYAAAVLLPMAYLAAAKLARRPGAGRAARYAFVPAAMLVVTALSVLDSRVSEDLSAFLLAGIVMALSFRCDARYFALCVLAAAAEYVLGRSLIGGTAPTIPWAIPFGVCALLVVAMAGALSRYDARAFVLNDELKAAERRSAEVARAEEKRASELAAALEERDLLLVELQHRVKNNLGLVAGILGVKEMQLGDDPAAMIVGDMRSRIQALASFYDRLYLSSDVKSVDFAPYASDILDTFVSTSAAGLERISVSRSFVPLRLRLQKAIALGLVMNELFSNSIKHAFPGGRSGKVAVSLESDGVFGRLRVEDDGIGMGGRGGPGVAESFGLRLVSLLCNQIDAEARDLGGPGARTEIVFPLP
jgi:two-component sensor histidine kinase